MVVGLSGGQGSGKSTISNILKILLKRKFNLKTVIAFQSMTFIKL